MTDSQRIDNEWIGSWPIADRAIALVHLPPADRRAQGMASLFWHVLTKFALSTRIYAIDSSYANDETAGDRGHSLILSAFPEPRLAVRYRPEESGQGAIKRPASCTLAARLLPTHRGVVPEPCSIFRGHS